MPYVALDPVNRAAGERAAAARWDALEIVRPELLPAIVLQRDLIGLVFDVLQTLGARPLPRLSLPPKYLAAKLGRGIPVLTGEPIPVPAALLKPALLGTCELLGRGGAGEAAEHIRSHIDETRIDAGSLLTASLKRDQIAIRTAATHSGLAPDLLWLVAELVVSPFAHCLERAVLAPATPGSPLGDALDAWTHGYCPFCGSWPVIAEVADTHQVLRCSFCAVAWALDSERCIYCHNPGATGFDAAPDENGRPRRVAACDGCHAYLKVVDAPALTPFPLLAIADLETMDLDVIAMERGYHRPPLREFAARS